MTRAAEAQQRPLFTEDVEIVPPGNIRAQLGFDFQQNQRFGLSGLQGDLTRFGAFGLHFGLSPNVSFSVEGVGRNFLNIRETGPAAIVLPPGLRTASSTSDFGDIVLSTKIKLRTEGRRTPGIGFRIGIMLPTSDQAKGIGTNTNNIFGSVLLGKTFGNGRLRTFGNVGLGILTDTLSLGAQQDVITYGVAGIYQVNDRFDVLGEVNGRHNPRRAKPGLESQSLARMGVRVRAGGFLWDVSALRGLTRFSPRSGVSLGVTYQFKAFEPAK